MKTALIAAAALAASAFAGSSDASAKDVNFALTFGGPNGYVQVGTPNARYGPRYDYKSDSKKGSKKYAKKQPKGQWNGKRGYGSGNWAPYPAYRRCAAPNQIRNRLQRQGWYGLHVRKQTPGYLLLTGHRHGAKYRLKVNRCSGYVAAARPVGGHQFGIYW